MSYINKFIKKQTTYEPKGNDYDNFEALLLIFNLDDENSERLIKALGLPVQDLNAFKRVLKALINIKRGAYE
jgi:hypothetical protein